MPATSQKAEELWKMAKDAQKQVVSHVRFLLAQYKQARGLFGGPNKAMLDSIKAYWPRGTETYFETFDTWLEQQEQMFENGIQEAMDDYANNLKEIEYTAPNIDQYKKMVLELTELWIANYEQFREQREKVNQESLDTFKKMFPAALHDVIENTNRWFMEENEKIETQILEQIRQYAENLDTK